MFLPSVFYWGMSMFCCNTELPVYLSNGVQFSVDRSKEIKWESGT